MKDEEDLRRELESLRTRVRTLEANLTQSETQPRPAQWRPPAFYAIHHALSGAILGLVAAAASLVFNVVCTVAAGMFPLQLIKIYLTFPMGADALTMESGLALAIGCCLYLFTGMVLGIPYSLILYRWFPKATPAVRFAVATVFSIALWLINFYGVLSWLQPALFGGRWIVDEVPWYVAAATHLVFGWTMAALLPLSEVNVAIPPVEKS